MMNPNENLILKDYANRFYETDFYFNDLPQVKNITIIVMSGDEIAEIVFKDGAVKRYDSGLNRSMDFYDGSYILYYENMTKREWAENLEKFNSRRDSYSLFWDD